MSRSGVRNSTSNFLENFSMKQLKMIAYKVHLMQHLSDYEKTVHCLFCIESLGHCLVEDVFMEHLIVRLMSQLCIVNVNIFCSFLKINF